MLGFEQDVVAALGFLEPPAERVLEGAAQLLVTVVGIGVLVVPFVLERFRLLGYLVAADIIAAGLVVASRSRGSTSDQPQQVANELAHGPGVERRWHDHGGRHRRARVRRS